MKWLRNLFKSHTAKRIEARQREEAQWRAANRTAGKPSIPDRRRRDRIRPLDETKVA